MNEKLAGSTISELGGLAYFKLKVVMSWAKIHYFENWERTFYALSLPPQPNMVIPRNGCFPAVPAPLHHVIRVLYLQYHTPPIHAFKIHVFVLQAVCANNAI
jgi:hypothetical protein